VPFNGRRFLADLREIQSYHHQPDFVVLPDRVADSDSLALSSRWLTKLENEGLRSWPMYLAVQDGMTAGDIPWDDIDGVFVGGTLDWKRLTVQSWTVASHQHGLPCHYARCGTAPRVAHAKSICVDSIDTCLPLWGARNLRLFLDALDQQMLFFDGFSEEMDKGRRNGQNLKASRGNIKNLLSGIGVAKVG